MQKFIFSVGLLLTLSACGGNGMCGANQAVFSDVSSPARAYLQKCNKVITSTEDTQGCANALELVFFEESRYPDKDEWTAFKVMRLTTGGTVYVFVSSEPDFSTSLIQNSEYMLFSWSNGYATVSRDEQQVNLTPVKAGSTIYVKYCEEDSAYCSEGHSIYLQDDSSDKEVDNIACDGQYRKLDAQIIPQSVSCLDQSLAGVAFCRYNDTKQCVVENQSDASVTIVMTVTERQSTIFQDVKLSAGEMETVDCKDLKDGDVVNVQVWRWSPDTILENIKTRNPDLEASFTFTTTPTIKVSTESVSTSRNLNIARTQGVDCSLLVEELIDTNDNTPTISATFACMNNSNDKVTAKLFLLKDNPVTSETFVIDYEVAQLTLDPQDTKEVWANASHGAYVLQVETAGWYNNSHLSANQPFQIYTNKDGWQIEHLDQSAYVK